MRATLRTGPGSRAPRAPHGFTLVEVMIAVGITAAVGALVAGAFQRTYAAKELTEQQDERFSSARVALTRMARELSEAFLSNDYDRKRYREPLTLFVGKDRGNEDDLLFTTMSHVRLRRDAKESDQAVLEYTLESDPDHAGERALFRREKAHLDDQPDRGGARAVVCEHVTTFDVQYWDWKRQEWARDWASNSPDRNGTLPTRVKVRLGVKMPDGKEQIYETQARVALLRPLAFGP
ncbi:MAG TPA: type II secretion system protein GspJ [Anaeromyxobacteraceae bacterium]|nr:type II secretion system protein GspJ [Anaeromyxobacteraceae bacterium]